MIDYKKLNTLLNSIVSFKEIYAKYNAELNFSINESALCISIIQNNKKLDYQFSMCLKFLNEEFTQYCNTILQKLEKGDFQ